MVLIGLTIKGVQWPLHSLAFQPNLRLSHVGVFCVHKCNHISVHVRSAMFLPLQILGSVYMGGGGWEGNFISIPETMGIDRLTANCMMGIT